MNDEIRMTNWDAHSSLVICSSFWFRHSDSSKHLLCSRARLALRAQPHTPSLRLVHVLIVDQLRPLFIQHPSGAFDGILRNRALRVGVEHAIDGVPYQNRSARRGSDRLLRPLAGAQLFGGT